ncbi:hypothetical protein BKP45_11435 [Anaerobacillus alkalidiazotrophicus]|uniref:Uncharacterized protein n=1 Tax=Anaerobacillus alkalidiazotrophicus TaxID=472963 RepID=A0A1S2M4F5_9BACI|nr:hypothetical protein [Anaerobacillus alkalidiazotrophicus]OIJ18193.1 hypothetical protein BKP45_17150 [Anaerobacillus alkalidiazotrophicus]OIJ19672.1 hypothetical protein BKP45_11435 [Anaerobacillus alkalidiazotrophicus]
MDYYRQFPETQFFPGFPFPPTPGPTPRPRDLERRVSQLERITQRQGEQINELTRRVRRLERQLGHGFGGPGPQY